MIFSVITRLSDQTIIGYGDIVRDTYLLRLRGSHAAIEADKLIEPTRPDTLFKTQPIAFPRYPERGDDHVDRMVDRRATKVSWVIPVELRARAKSPNPQACLSRGSTRIVLSTEGLRSRYRTQIRSLLNRIRSLRVLGLEPCSPYS